MLERSSGIVVLLAGARGRYRSTKSQFWKDTEDINKFLAKATAMSHNSARAGDRLCSRDKELERFPPKYQDQQDVFEEPISTCSVHVFEVCHRMTHGLGSEEYLHNGSLSPSRHQLALKSSSAPQSRPSFNSCMRSLSQSSRTGAVISCQTRGRSGLMELHYDTMRSPGGQFSQAQAKKTSKYTRGNWGMAC